MVFDQDGEKMEVAGSARQSTEKAPDHSPIQSSQELIRNGRFPWLFSEVLG